MIFISIYIYSQRNQAAAGYYLEKEIYICIKDLVKQVGDLGVVAEVNDRVIGNVWTKIIPAYGRLNDATPEVAISLLPEFRGLDIGTKLMKRLFDLLIENGLKQTLLSVQKDSSAVRFYKRLGYNITEGKT